MVPAAAGVVADLAVAVAGEALVVVSVGEVILAVAVPAVVGSGTCLAGHNCFRRCRNLSLDSATIHRILKDG